MAVTLLKKGIIFSLMALGLAMLFTIMFAGYYEEPLDARNEAVTTRVTLLNQGIKDFYDYSEKALAASAYKSLLELYYTINESGDYLPSGTFEDSLSGCILGDDPCYGQKNNLSAYLDNYSRTLNENLKVPLTYHINSVEVTDEGRWSIELEANISVQVSDSYASWSLFKVITSSTTNEGTYDPLFISSGFAGMHLGGVEYRRIIHNYNDHTQWDLSSFSRFFYDGEYRASHDGPCLSDRFENSSNTDNECGIETILDADKHTNLKDNDHIRITHTDYQVLELEEHACNDSDNSFGNDPRVSIKAVNLNLTLSKEDATSYNLDDNDIWYYNDTIMDTTARCCPGFVGPDSSSCP